jgi:NAD/NADP transhydrogenase beta subunit
MTTAEFVFVVSTLVSIVVGGLLGVTVSALVDRFCRGMTLAIVCVALALAGCATRIAADDVDEAAARQAADAECRRFGFERESEDYKQCMTTLARR